MERETLVSIWERAEATEIGLRVKTNKTKGLMNALYEVRKERPEWLAMHIHMPPADDELWIVKKLAEPEGKELNPKDFEEL